MYKSFVCFIFFVVTVLLVITVFFSGMPSMLVDINLIVGMLFFLILVLLASGTLKDFFRCFTLSSIKCKNVTSKTLRHSLDVIHFVIKTVLLLGAFLSLAALILTMFNRENPELIGQNLFAAMAAPLYGFLIAFLLYPIETIVKRTILTYSDDDETETAFTSKINSPEKMLTIEKEANFVCVDKKKGGSLKKIIFMLCFIFFCVLCIIFFGIKSLKNVTKIPLPIDVFSLVVNLIFVIISLVFSGCLKEIILICMSKVTGRGNRIVFCETLELSIKSLLSSGVIMTIVSLIAVFSRLDNSQLLVPNTYVALLPISYSIVFSLVLIVIRMRINKR